MIGVDMKDNHIIEDIKKAEQGKSKLQIVIGWFVLLLFVAATVMVFVFSTEIFGENSIFNQNISDNHFVNSVYQLIPVILKTFQIVIICLVLSKIICFILRKSFKRSNRAITIGKLLVSCVKWFTTIVAVLVILNAWGVDTATLVASAGVLTLIVGLGAQSLVADIVAGIFIVFEGSFQVGDIVIIDGWRGTVQEIGIRTTKIIDGGGNIKIINNSEIKTIVNQTRELSLATCTVGIEYGESLPRVEKVVEINLPLIAEKIPAIVDGPYYKGVSALNQSSVDLLFVANCKEEDIYQVQRDLNREIKLVSDANNINIPFPQIVVNTPNSNEETVY